MILILCFLNSLCYNPSGQQVQTPVVGVVRSIDYDYKYTLSGAAVVSLNAELTNYDKSYQLYYAYNDTWSELTPELIFDLPVIPSTVMIEAVSNNNLIAFSEFTLP